MLDCLHIPTGTGAADVQVFTGTSTAAGNDWQTWLKPRGKTMLDLLLISKGGNGGTGVIGAVSTAAGGGGGGSASQTRVRMPLYLLPDVLYLSLAGISTTNAIASYVTVCMSKLTAGAGAPVANDVLAVSNGGGNGGNAAGATAGAAGAAGGVVAATAMPIGGNFMSALAGQAGIIGGTTGAAAALTLPVTGLLITGGTGGAGLGASASAGTAGGSFTVAGQFPAHAGGLGTAVATTPPGDGNRGYQPISKLFYNYGGTGGGSTHGSATGGGLVQSKGGHGAYGSGGGGMGGALTGSSAGAIGMGGPAICIITCW